MKIHSLIEQMEQAVKEHQTIFYLKLFLSQKEMVNKEEYKIILQKANQHNIKCYLVLDHFLFDQEIKQVLDFLKINLLPDAFVVADMGLWYRLQQTYPHISIFVSPDAGTQHIDDVTYLEANHISGAYLSSSFSSTERNRLKKHSSFIIDSAPFTNPRLSEGGYCFMGSLLKVDRFSSFCCSFCWDLYMANKKTGHLLYVPSINRKQAPKKLKGEINYKDRFIPTLHQVDLLEEEQIKEGYSITIAHHDIKPEISILDFSDIDVEDVFVKCESKRPISYCKEDQENVFYWYSQCQCSYQFNQPNISFECYVKAGVVREILYSNHKGEETLFQSIDSDYQAFEFQELFDLSSGVNIYRIRYLRSFDQQYVISKVLYHELKKKVMREYPDQLQVVSNTFPSIDTLYVETNDLSIVDSFIDYPFVKMIYHIPSVMQLKKMKKVIERFSTRLIYKLPLFYGNTDTLEPYYSLFEHQEVMFTRISQLYTSRNIVFKKKYTDYTIPIWNHTTKQYLDQFDIDVYTAPIQTPLEQHENIFQGSVIQYIIGGRVPLLYTKHCFRHIYGCHRCLHEVKYLHNKDKKIDFRVCCEDDYRYIITERPVLNCIKQANSQVQYRYFTYGQSLEQIKESISLFQQAQSVEHLLKHPFWGSAYSFYEVK